MYRPVLLELSMVLKSVKQSQLSVLLPLELSVVLKLAKQSCCCSLCRREAV